MGPPRVAAQRCRLVAAFAAVCLLAVAAAAAGVEAFGQRRALQVQQTLGPARHRHAYAAMMYMGTPRDYDFYVAVRVMMRSLARVGADADRVLIASADVPRDWVRAM
jgi:hypothetical protein